MPMTERFSMRLPEATYAECARIGEREGKEVGTIAREAMESGLADGNPPRAVIGKLTRRMTLSLTADMRDRLTRACRAASRKAGAPVQENEVARCAVQRGVELIAEKAKSDATQKLRRAS